MFIVGDIVRNIHGTTALTGRVTHVFSEIADDIEQVVTIQPMGTDDETLQVKRLASELALLPAHLSQESEKGWGLK